MVNDIPESREKVVYQAGNDRHTDLQSHLWIPVKDFLEVAHWATNRQIQLGVRGFAKKRYTTLERLLKARTNRGDLRSGMYGKDRIYAKPRKTRNFDLLDTAAVYHGLSVTECYFRFRASKEGDPQPERLFRGYGKVPEFGILYESLEDPEKNRLLLCEFSTRYDVGFTGKIRGKLSGLVDCLPKIEEDFGAKAIVVFVLDVPREKVKLVVEKYKPLGPFRFIDAKSFFKPKVEDGKAFELSYIFPDGSERSLKNA